MAIAAFAILGTALALLFVPADVSLQIERERTFKVVFGFHWWFVRIHRPLNTGGERETSRPERPHRSSSIPLRNLVAVGRVPGLWAGIRRFVARLARSVRVLQVNGRVRLGTGDPADTGRLWALVWPAAVWSNRWPQVDLGIVPDFSGTSVTGTVGGTVRFYPAKFAYGIGATVFSMLTIRLVVAVLRSRPWKH